MGWDWVAILLMRISEVRWYESRQTVVLQILSLFHSLRSWMSLFG